MILSSVVQNLLSLIIFHLSILGFVAIAFGASVMKSLLMVRKGYSFSFLHMASQFSQHHLLNRESFPHCLFLTIVKDQMVVDV